MHCYESVDGLPLAAVTVRRFKLLLKRIWVKVMFYNVLSHMHYFQASSVLHWFLVKCLIASWMQYNSVLFANMVYISKWYTALTVRTRDFLRVFEHAGCVRLQALHLAIRLGALCSGKLLGSGMGSCAGVPQDACVGTSREVLHTHTRVRRARHTPGLLTDTQQPVWCHGSFIRAGFSCRVFFLAIFATLSANRGLPCPNS